MDYVWVVTVTYAGDGLAGWFTEVYETEGAALAGVGRLLAAEVYGEQRQYERHNSDTRRTWRHETDNRQDVITLEQKEVNR